MDAILKGNAPTIEHTPPEFSIAPEKWWLEVYFPFWEGILFVRGELLHFQGVAGELTQVQDMRFSNNLRCSAKNIQP